MPDTQFLTTIFKTPDATAAFASALAPLLNPGDTILLEGPIGAGKSHFARSVIQARLAKIGMVEDVPSPTFTLVQTYDDSISEIWHADLYRVTSVSEIDELGLWDAFGSAICLVEWPDRLGTLAPTHALTVTLKQGRTEGERSACFTSSDPEWKSRVLQAGVSDDG